MFDRVSKFSYFFATEILNLIIKDDKKLFEIIYKFIHHEEINWDDPKCLSEKINYRKIYQKNPLFSLCADKYRVRDYVKNHTQICKLIPLLGVYDSFDEIDFSKFDCDVILKTNHASSVVAIIKKGDEIDMKALKKQMDFAMSMDFGEFSRESHYSKIPPKIIAEKLMTDESGNIPNDIKIHCFYGEPKFIQIANPEHTTNDIFDLDWNRLDVIYRNEPSNNPMKKPKNLEQILKVSSELSNEFDYVRVDLYNLGDEIYFGELTFTPNGGFAKILPREFDYEWGSYWDVKKSVQNQRC
ncbi:ATP-grasp fold amidoligase family protein [Campylobacter corcagiensis]|uniref:Uncharacterized protein n=1 Tax=Campylobacter corcagiensis TaxID=1448857 RepID=A0A7M1LF67_9BACT|nr:ATP-grasp fold amidoligase family protein [Campylobacter corcagiensis]QKF64595.1 TupA-like ATPgrasp protein [Campylobacter corcagiensis]QOQ87232.1 hypothetical protein IMC76_08490 [Campylobacter corcagiensis]